MVPIVRITTIKRAREYIFEKGFSVASAGIKRMLEARSLLPQQVGANLYLRSTCANFMKHPECLFAAACAIRLQLLLAIYA